MTTTTDDGIFIQRLKAGDLDALGEIYDRHNTDIYRAAMGITCSQSAAEKILQECFLTLHRKVHELDAAQELRAWLYRETVNLIFAWAKQPIRWPMSAERSASTPQNGVSRSEQDEFTAAIAALEIHQRVVIVLHYYSELDVDEIADILEYSPGVIKSHLYYGRENMRRRLVLANITPGVRGGLASNVRELFLHNKEI